MKNIRMAIKTIMVGTMLSGIKMAEGVDIRNINEIQTQTDAQAFTDALRLHCTFMHAGIFYIGQQLVVQEVRGGGVTFPSMEVVAFPSQQSNNLRPVIQSRVYSIQTIDQAQALFDEWVAHLRHIGFFINPRF